MNIYSIFNRKSLNIRLICKMKKRLLNIRELADYIGKKPQTIRNEISRGEFLIPRIKLRGALRFDIKDVDDFIDNLERKK